MARTLKVHCDSCHEQPVLHPNAIDLRVCRYKYMSHYVFTCTCCGAFNRKPASPYIIDLLLFGGVIAVVIDVPAEFVEAHPDLGVITSDTLLDFHEAIERMSSSGLPVQTWL